MWLNNTMHFGLRGRQEHQTMMWGDVELERDASGLEVHRKGHKDKKGACWGQSTVHGENI